MLVAHLSALIEIVRFAPDVFEEHSEIIVEFLLKKILLGAAPSKDVSCYEHYARHQFWTQQIH